MTPTVMKMHFESWKMASFPFLQSSGGFNKRKRQNFFDDDGEKILVKLSVFVSVTAEMQEFL